MKTSVASKAPKVSVLVPIYNVEKYLRQCLDSLVEQTLKDIEIICIDDGSTDSSPEIIKEYADKDDRIVVITKKNSGYGDSMNKGLAKARGEYIGISEPDDFVELDTFEKLYDLAKVFQAEVARCGYYLHAGGKDEKKQEVSQKDTFRLIDPVAETWVFNLMPAVWTSVYSRKFLKKYSLSFLPTPGASYQDAGFAFKVRARARGIVITDECLVHYRIDNESSSSNDNSKVFCIVDEYNEIERWLKQNQLFEQFGTAMQPPKFENYWWNLWRATPKLKKPFAKVLKKDFDAAIREGLCLKSDFLPESWERLQFVHKNSVGKILKRIYNDQHAEMSRKSLVKGLYTKLAPPSINYFAQEMREIKGLLVDSGSSNIINRLDAIEKKIVGLESKLDTYAIQIYKKESETDFDARKRMFRNIPEATGAARLFQQVNTKLLDKINEFCGATNTQYWMWAGSAVAVSGRGSAIPCDDDIDICMMRDDFERFKEYVNNDTEYFVTTVYDYFSHNVQHRFISRRKEIWNFIDIVICDWAIQGGAIAEQKYQEIVDLTRKEMDASPKLEYWRQHLYLETPGEPKSHQYGLQEYIQDEEQYHKCRDAIDDILTSGRETAKRIGVICDQQEANAVVYGLENLFNIRNRPYIWDKKIIYPIKKMPYENIFAMTANRDEDFCNLIYRGWPFIPNNADVYHHQAEDTLSLGAQQQLRDFLEEE